MSPNALEKRVSELEETAWTGYVKLPDGTRLDPACCFRLMRTALKIEGTGRKPAQSDFAAEDWHQLRQLAILPDPAKISPLLDMTCQIAREMDS